MILSIICCILLTFADATVDFTYTAQDEWAGVCNAVTALHQSPIDIVTDEVQVGESLTQLVLTNWEETFEGDFFNNGNRVQFNLNTNDLKRASTTNHLGTYYLQQFHMHWGDMSGKGSEHTIDHKPAEMEIHFVQVKDRELNTSEANHYSIIAVLADVDENAPIEGIWAQLNAGMLQTFNATVEISDFHMHQLLPESLHYWHYQGSFTTPPCSENVAWFVLQHRITVPAAFLDILRHVQQADSSNLAFNYRREQDIATRTVHQFPVSGQLKRSANPFIMLSLLVTLLAWQW